MSSAGFSQSTRRAILPGSQALTQRVNWQTKLGGLLGLVLLFAPRTRIVIGAPLYLIDVLAFILLISPVHGSRFTWVPSQPFTRIIQVYMALIVVSELRGMLAYGTLIESIYMMGRFIIAISVFYTLPKLVSSTGDMTSILKGIIVGALLSAVTVIMYSIGPLRPLLISTIYSSSILNPGWQELIEAVRIFGAGEAAMRGRSLVGAATLTAGFLATTWPLSFLAYKRFENTILWKRVALATTIIAPVGILMTYGRGAWLMVASVVILISVFGLASARKILLLSVAGGVIMFTQFNINSDLFYMERLISASQDTIDNPFADVSTAERLLSYIEPIAHLAENPIWLFVGAGRTGDRGSTSGGMSEPLYDEGGRATHSAFAMAYYSFGFIATVCQVLLIITGFVFIFSRMRISRRVSKDQQLVWQALFMSWTTFTLWWGSGHGMVGQPRGAMLMFFMVGLLVCFEKLRVMQLYQPRPVRKRPVTG